MVRAKKEDRKTEKTKRAQKSRAEKEIRTTKTKRLSKREVKNMGFFARLNYNRKLRADKEARRRAEDLASLPKEPVKRFFARLAPKRVFRYLFSWRGVKNFLKFCAACLLIGIIGVGAAFLYFKKDINNIQLADIVISETVNTYLDRNGVVLWEDTGDSNYRLVVDGSEIASSMRQATVAIEDKNFYNHPGVDFTALVRAVLSTVSGKGVQGGSTLTQQLIKQVYFADEAASENRGGLARKIKELILAVELEKMYDKEQIITMYLNESPYGGRRNGVESAAQTYFGKSAADLTLAESALLAGIPNNPAVLNPYNEYGNEALIARQHKVLDSMVELGYISEDEAKEAKEVAILDTIKPESSQYANMLAPHFVLEVKSILEEKYGISTMRSGGFTIKTTLDYEAQKIAEDAVATGDSLRYKNGSDNVALVSLDVETSQIVAMVGSIDFYNAEYGEVNATTSLLEPGSTIKPILDYAPLFVQRSGLNYAPGTILKDENIDKIYCAGYYGSCALRNASGKFFGNVTIRQALGNSFNIGAVKALYINGIENSLNIAHDLGDVSYCADNTTAGLSMAIGSGCTVRPVEHANAYASLARGGSFKDISYVLEVKNSSGDIIEEWEDKQGKQVVNEEVAYLISSILSDSSARTLNFGGQATSFGFVVPGVWTASKTGTTTTTNADVTKDNWMASYSTAVSTIVWNGNHDGSGVRYGTNEIVRRVINDYMERVHKEVLANNGKWSSGDQPVKPAGIKTMTVNGKTDIWPSWYNEKTSSGVTKETLSFNKYNRKLATSCTPSDQIIELEVTKIVDPMTKTEVYNIPDGYDRESEDDCAYVAPKVKIRNSGDTFYITVTGSNIVGGVYALEIDGVEIERGTVPSVSFSTDYKVKGTETSVKITVSDSLGGSATGNLTLTPTVTPSGGSTDDSSS